jgi:hypothetical protein
MGMRLFTGWVMAAGFVFASTAANAQVPAPYALASDIEEPYAGVRGSYAAVLPEAPPQPADGPRLLPPLEVYTVLREGRFSPLGIPRLRGFVYTIAVIDRGGTTGRLAIDARTGQIVRFMPTSRMGYGPAGPLPFAAVGGPPRPPRGIPRVATRTPPPPRAGEAQPLDAKPATGAPAQQTAAAPAKPAEPQTTGQAAPPAQAAAPTQAAVPAIVEAKPTPQIAPTQDMPKVQGLD